MTAVDKRVFERIDGSLNVIYSHVLPENNAEYITNSKNLSGGGIRLELNYKFKKKGLLILKISTPYSPKIETKCMGRVVWIWKDSEGSHNIHHKTRLYDAGIEFINQDLLQIGRLYNYLEGQKKGIF